MIVLGTLVTFFAVGLITILVIGIALSLLGIAFSLAWGISSFILFKLAPLILIGWVVLKLFERRRPRPPLSNNRTSDWLESGK